MARVLYGAGVQGIQDFIFKTNKLQEIVGASEIVKNIEEEFLKISGYAREDKNLILNAAGNIKAIFDDEELLKKVVSDFPKIIMKNAYGITISQAIVTMTGEKIDEKIAIRELETKLKTQRNKPTIPLDITIGMMALNPKTSRPAVSKKDSEMLDMATVQKRDAYKKWFDKNIENEKDFENSKEMDYIANSKGKVAIIHADGNNIGQILTKLKIPLSEFSSKLTNATKISFLEAKGDFKKIRQIVLGGDDMTIICDASIALSITKVFLEVFEKETKKIIEGGMSACAGIAFANKKYPFHYAASLAEELCSVAKKQAKKINNNAPSCIMFHNVQSSSFQNWSEYIKDELTINNPTQTIRCDYGPYYLKSVENETTIDDLLNDVEKYKQEGSPIARLRSWLSELYKDEIKAKSMLERIYEVSKYTSKWKYADELKFDKLIVEKDGILKNKVYDILQIHSVSEDF